jgi:hypothetical protein
MKHYIITNYSLSIKSDNYCEYETKQDPENGLLKLLNYDTEARMTLFLDEIVVAENDNGIDKYRSECKAFVDKSPSYKDLITKINTGRTLIFVHGVNCPPKRFEYFIRKIEKKYITNGADSAFDNLVMIVWHSIGEYRKGRRRAVRSAKLFATWLCNLNEVIEANSTSYIMCQSSGNYLLQYLQVRWVDMLRKQMLPLRTRKIFYVAADIDFDLYQAYTDAQVLSLSEKFGIIYNHTDLILQYGYNQFHPKHRKRMGLEGAKSIASRISSYDIYDDIKDKQGIVAIDDYDEDDRQFIEDLEREYPTSGFTGLELHLSHFYFIWSKEVVRFISRLVKE